jgi:hypothetical protein
MIFVVIVRHRTSLHSRLPGTGIIVCRSTLSHRAKQPPKNGGRQFDRFDDWPPKSNRGETERSGLPGFDIKGL